MKHLDKYALIVAGGSGKRMGSETSKQFLLLKDLPILMHTIRVFHQFNTLIKIIVVLPEEQMMLWEKLCAKYHFLIPHKIVAGGKERFFSVKNGLKEVKENGIVGIHDGVRPLVNHETLKRCYKTAQEKGNAVPVVDVNETIRKVENSVSITVSRSAHKLVQTPQCFRTEIIKKAFEQEYQPIFTDDASVAEAAGVEINLVPGNNENIKITTPADLKIAEVLLSV